jgi:hypothetical protein
MSANYMSDGAAGGRYISPSFKSLIIWMPAEMAEAESKRIPAAVYFIRMIHQAFPEILYNMLGPAKSRVGEFHHRIHIAPPENSDLPHYYHEPCQIAFINNIAALTVSRGK